MNVDPRSKAKGDVTELLVASRLISLGCKVYFPFSGTGDLDIVAEYKGKYLGIQCKTLAYRKDRDCLRANLSCKVDGKNVKYDPSLVPVFCLYAPYNQSCYFVRNVGQASVALKLRFKTKDNHISYLLGDEFLKLFYEKIIIQCDQEGL